MPAGDRERRGARGASRWGLTARCRPRVSSTPPTRAGTACRTSGRTVRCCARSGRDRSRRSTWVTPGARPPASAPEPSRRVVTCRSGPRTRRPASARWTRDRPVPGGGRRRSAPARSAGPGAARRPGWCSAGSSRRTPSAPGSPRDLVDLNGCGIQASVTSDGVVLGTEIEPGRGGVVRLGATRYAGTSFEGVARAGPVHGRRRRRRRDHRLPAQPGGHRRGRAGDAARGRRARTPAAGLRRGRHTPLGHRPAVGRPGVPRPGG